MKQTAASGRHALAAALILSFGGLGLLPSDALAQGAAATACDILTAHPDDAQRVAEPVPWNERDAGRAVPACEEALRRDPTNLRLQYQLGLAHDSAGNHQASFRLYAEAAQRGYVAAGMAVGWALANGQGVERDDANAVRWYRWAAEQGHAGAANTLGFMFENGRGVPRDLRQAAEWYLRSYQLTGRAVAGYNLARLMVAGRDVPRDIPRAVELLRAAAHDGRADAALFLSLMAERGEARQVSRSELIQLLALAETGSAQRDRARRSLDQLTSQGLAAEIAQARRTAAVRVAQQERQNEDRRRSREHAYAAAVGGGGLVGPVTPRPVPGMDAARPAAPTRQDPAAPVGEDRITAPENPSQPDAAGVPEFRGPDADAQEFLTEAEIRLVGQHFFRCLVLPPMSNFSGVVVRLYADVDRSGNVCNVVPASALPTDPSGRTLWEALRRAFLDATCSPLPFPSDRLTALVRTPLTFGDPGSHPGGVPALIPDDQRRRASPQQSCRTSVPAAPQQPARSAEQVRRDAEAEHRAAEEAQRQRNVNEALARYQQYRELFLQYQNRNQSLLEQILNYTTTSSERGSADPAGGFHIWLSGHAGRHRCVMTQVISIDLRALNPRTVPVVETFEVDLRSLNVRGFRLWSEGGRVVRVGDENIFIPVHRNAVGDRLENAWRLAFRECPGRQTPF